MNLPPITTLDTDRSWKGESLSESRAWRNRAKDARFRHKCFGMRIFAVMR
jgi:hypothetical protein